MIAATRPEALQLTSDFLANAIVAVDAEVLNAPEPNENIPFLVGLETANSDGIATWRLAQILSLGIAGPDRVTLFDDEQYSGLGEDLIQTRGGDDVIYGNQNDDMIVSRFGFDVGNAGTGYDRITLDDADQPAAGQADHRLLGGAGGDDMNDRLDDDFAAGGACDDTQMSGEGVGRLGSEGDDATDRRTDLERDIDRIDLVSMGLKFEGIFGSHDGSGAAIEAGNVAIRLDTTDAGELNEESFLF